MARAPNRDDHDRSKIQTALRWITIAAGIVAVVLISLSIAAHLLVDAEAVSTRIRSSIAASTSRPVSVEFESVTPTLLSRSLRAEGVTIELGGVEPSAAEAAGDADGAAEADSAPAERLVVTIRAAELEGISLGRLALGNGFVVERARFVEPRVRLHRPPKEASATDSSHATSSTGQEGGGSAPSIPYLEVGGLAIVDGTIQRTTGDGGGRGRLRADSIQVALSGLIVDSARADGWLTLDDLDISIGNYERLSADSTSVTRMTGLRVAGVDAPLVVDSVTVRPLVDLAEFLRRVEERKDRIDAALIGISVQDFDYRRFIERRDVTIRSIHADSLYLHVHLDRRLPSGTDDNPPLLPNRIMRGLERRVRIDTIALRRGDILYTERLPSADSNAELWFREISGSARNITNDSSLMSEETPTVVKARARFLGEAPAQLIVELPLLSENLDARYLGNVGPFPARALNEVTHPLAGILLSGGAADTAWFDINVADGRAEGAVVVLYQGLEVEIVGKGSSTQNLIETFKTMIAEDKISSSNPRKPGQPPAVGSVLYTQEPDDAFFLIFWRSLRSGLRDVVGL